MAIPSQQIGWSQKSKLLWFISKQLERLTQVAGGVVVNPITGGWSVVTGGAAGDGTVAQYSSTGFNITGPDDSDANGWVYIKKYFSEETQLVIDYQWASVDEGTGVDWPIYCIDATEPTGEPSDLTVRADSTPQQSTWNITVPAGNWFSVGIYSDDSCCGRGFLSVDVTTIWAFVPAEISVFPANSNGYTLYSGAWTYYDDGQTSDTFPLAGDFFYNNDGGRNTMYLSTNGNALASDSSYAIYGNGGDLFLTPGDPLDDGTTQNFWYQNTGSSTKWKTSILVYCGHCCGTPQQQTPYSYIINIYRDSQYQYIETCSKTNVADNSGPDNNTNSASTATQVWQSPLDGSSWTLLGYGSIS